MTRNMPKSTRAIVAVAAEMPEKPKKPATIEITRNIKAHFNMDIVLPYLPEEDAPKLILFQIVK